MCLVPLLLFTFSQGSVILFFAQTINKLIKCVCACAPIHMSRCAYVGQWIICGSFLPDNVGLGGARPQVLMLGSKYFHLYTLSRLTNFTCFSFFFLLSLLSNVFLSILKFTNSLFFSFKFNVMLI